MVVYVVRGGVGLERWALEACLSVCVCLFYSFDCLIVLERVGLLTLTVFLLSKIESFLFFFFRCQPVAMR